MPVPTWPSAVGYRPLRSGLNLTQRFAPPIATEMEGGPERMRPRTSSVWARLAYQLSLPNEAFEALDRFYVVDLVRGTLRFHMPVGRPYQPDPWPSRLVSIEPGSWQARPDTPGRMLVSFTLNVLDW